MCLERKSRSILPGKFRERLDGADESHRNAAGVTTGPPSMGAPKDQGHSQGLTPVWIWYSQAGSSSSSSSIPINSTGWESGIVLTPSDRCNTRSNREEFIFKFISAGRIEMIIHSPKMPLGSRITPPASQHPCTACVKERRAPCSGRIPVTGLPCRGNFAWAEKEKLPLELHGPTHTI